MIHFISVIQLTSFSSWTHISLVFVSKFFIEIFGFGFGSHCFCLMICVSITISLWINMWSVDSIQRSRSYS